MLSFWNVAFRLKTISIPFDGNGSQPKVIAGLNVTAQRCLYLQSAFVCMRVCYVIILREIFSLLFFFGTNAIHIY